MLDRKYQHRLLEALAASYTKPKTFDISVFLDGSEEAKERYIANMWYLGEHNLVKHKITRTISGGFLVSDTPEITCHGIDLLADDGGLTATLREMTIRLHADTLRDLIEAKIVAAPLNHEDKKKLLHRLHELPYESIKHVAMKLIDLGLGTSPAALEWLSKLLQNAP